MRKSRVRAIREAELQNPEGMSSASFRRAKRDHSNGLRRRTQPKDRRPKGTPGFPKGTEPVIESWREKVKIARVITTESGKDKERKKVPVRILYKRKPVTRVIARKKK